MLVRAAILSFLSFALIAVAWAHCPVGAALETVHSHDGGVDHASNHGNHNQSEKGCDDKDVRACDAVVQAAPLQPLTLGLTGGWSVPLTTMIVRMAPFDSVEMRAAGRPPDRFLRFKDIRARTGRLLI